MPPEQPAPKPRTIAPGPGIMPTSRGFAARSAHDIESRRKDAAAVDATAVDDILSASNVQKVAYYNARAQQLANDLMCSVLVHWHIIPGHEHTPPTLDAVLIPANEKQALPEVKSIG